MEKAGGRRQKENRRQEAEGKIVFLSLERSGDHNNLYPENRLSYPFCLFPSAFY
jgi:hypothetical protein